MKIREIGGSLGSVAALLVFALTPACSYLEVHEDKVVQSDATASDVPVSDNPGDTPTLHLPTANFKCSVAFDPAPRTNDHYAPRLVLNGTHDADPDQDGAQIRVVVTSTPGAYVSLWTGQPEASDVLVAAPADDKGQFSQLVTLEEGEHDIQVRCNMTGGDESKVVTAPPVVVDSVAPECMLSNITDGETITSADDEDPAKGGTQVSVSALFMATDVSGQKSTFTVRGGGEKFELAGSDIKSGGSVATLMFWNPGSNSVSVEASDYAGNYCSSTLSVEFK